MKTLKMFELRDSLIIRNLQNLSRSLVEIDDQAITACLHRSVCDFSYDVVASKPMFRENKCVEILVLSLIVNISCDLKEESDDLYQIIQKEILQYPENQQVVSKSLPDISKCFRGEQD